MRWNVPVTVTVILCSGIIHVIAYQLADSDDLLDDEFIEEEPNSNDNMQRSLPIIYDKEQLDRAMNLLAKLLIFPWPKDRSPIVYLGDNTLLEEGSSNTVPDESIDSLPSKRSRYYRMYPWKRQTPNYDPYNRFMCSPTKQDLRRLLVALRDVRQGYRAHQVDLCNKKLPAVTVYNRMHFVGK